MTSLKAASSVPGVWVAVYKAKGSVWVSPGIFDTKVIVAPNSAKHLANASVTPVITEGSIKGNVTVKKQFMREAPFTLATSSSFGSKLSKPNLIDLTKRGKATTAAAIAAPFHEKFTEILKFSYKNLPIGPFKLNIIRSKYPITTGGKIKGKYTNIFNIEINIFVFLDRSQAIIIPGTMDADIAAVAMSVDNLSASISNGVIIILFL